MSWAALAVIFGFFDLEISKAIVNQESAWAGFLQRFGEIPGYGLLFLACAVYFGGFFRNPRMQKLPAAVLVLLAVGLAFAGRQLGIDHLVRIGAAGALVTAAAAIVTLGRDWRPWQDLAGRVLLVAVITGGLFVQVAGLFWGRVRFRELVPGFADYTPWWQIRGIAWGLKVNSSFPSGHASMAAIFLPLLALARDRRWRDPLKLAAWAAVAGWTILVAVSRVVIGAHFASDVLFSGCVAALCTMLLWPERPRPAAAASAGDG